MMSLLVENYNATNNYNFYVVFNHLLKNSFFSCSNNKMNATIVLLKALFVIQYSKN
jgi:hypothetical protein